MLNIGNRVNISLSDDHIGKKLTVPKCCWLCAYDILTFEDRSKSYKPHPDGVSETEVSLKC